MGETWITDTWRCLLLEIPSCAMARPQRPYNNYTNQINTSNLNSIKKFTPPAMAVLDSKSRRFQAKIVDACRCLGLNKIHSEVAVVCHLGTHRTFLAWRERQKGETFNALLRGDTDNYTKNCLDGLQKARIINNDRGVFRLIAAKPLQTNWLTLPISIDSELTKAAIKYYNEGFTYQEIKNNLILSHAKMAELFSDYQLHNKRKNKSKTGQKVGRPSLKTYTTKDVEKAINIAEKSGIRSSQRQTGVPKSKIKTALMAKFGAIPKRAGRPKSKILSNSVISKIQLLAQDGNSIASIQRILNSDINIANYKNISIKKIREILRPTKNNQNTYKID